MIVQVEFLKYTAEERTWRGKDGQQVTKLCRDAVVLDETASPIKCGFIDEKDHSAWAMLKRGDTFFLYFRLDEKGFIRDWRPVPAPAGKK